LVLFCSAEKNETGKYKLVEHNEEYVMESNNCLADEIKPHFPPPLNAQKKPPTENENHVVKNLQNTPLSETAREAFFQARNIGLDTFMTGIQPARLDNGIEPVQMIPDYTENATLDDVFVPPTMNCTGAIPFGPDLYVPNSAPSQSSAIPPSNADSSETVKSGFQQQQQQRQFNEGHDITPDSRHTHKQTTSTPSSGYITDNSISIPDIDQSILESAFNSADIDGLAPLMQWLNNPDLTDSTLNIETSQRGVTQKQNDNGLSPFNFANSSIDNIIDQLVNQIPTDSNDLNTDPGQL